MVRIVALFVACAGLCQAAEPEFILRASLSEPGVVWLQEDRNGRIALRLEENGNCSAHMISWVTAEQATYFCTWSLKGTKILLSPGIPVYGKAGLSTHPLEVEYRAEESALRYDGGSRRLARRKSDG